MKTTIYYSKGKGETTNPVIQIDDKVAASLGSNLVPVNPTNEAREASKEVHNKPVLSISWDPLTRECYVTTSEQGHTLGHHIGRLPWRVNAPLTLGMPDAEVTEVEATLVGDILHFTLPEKLKPGLSRPRGKGRDRAVSEDKLDVIISMLDDLRGDQRVWEPQEALTPEELMRAAFAALPEGKRLMVPVAGHGMQPLGDPKLVRVL